MPSSRPKPLWQRSSAAVLPALLLWACGNSDSAPGVSYDDVEVDAEVAPVEVEDGGRKPPPIDPIPIGGRSDSGRPLDAGAKDSGTTSDAGASDAADLGDARTPVEQGALIAVERLLVADGKSARVHALDVNAREFLDTFNVNGDGPIYAGADGRYGFVLEGAQNQVQVLSTGLGDVSTGMTPKLAAPSLQRVSLTGLAPAAFATHGDQVAILFAGASQLSTFDGESVSSGSALHSANVVSSTTGPAVLIHLGDRLIVSERLASGGSQLRLFDEKLASLSRPDLECTDPEGWAQTQDTVAVGCSDRVLLWNTTQTSATSVRYPSGLSDQRVHKLVANPAVLAFLTMLGTKLCLLTTEFTCIDAPEGLIDYTFDASGKRALVLSRDGRLHVLDGETLDARDKLPMFDALPDTTPEGELPGLAVGRRNVYVSEPGRARVHIVDSASGAEIGELPVPGGFPTKISVFKYPL